MKMSENAMAAFLLVSALGLLAGCGKKAEDAIAAKALEKAIKADGGDADVKIKDGKVVSATVTKDGQTTSITNSENGGMKVTGENGTVTVATGDEAKVPADWPKDIPVYPGIKLDMVSGGPGNYVILGTVSDAPEKGVAFYEKALKDGGWTEAMNMKQPGGAMLMFSKDKRSVAVNVAKAEAGTTLGVTVSSQ